VRIPDVVFARPDWVVGVEVSSHDPVSHSGQSWKSDPAPHGAALGWVRVWVVQADDHDPVIAPANPECHHVPFHSHYLEVHPWVDRESDHGAGFLVLVPDASIEEVPEVAVLYELPQPVIRPRICPELLQQQNVPSPPSLLQKVVVQSGDFLQLACRTLRPFTTTTVGVLKPHLVWCGGVHSIPFLAPWGGLCIPKIRRDALCHTWRISTCRASRRRCLLCVGSQRRRICDSSTNASQSKVCTSVVD
jgi:hypothetical protein